MLRVFIPEPYLSYAGTALLPTWDQQWGTSMRTASVHTDRPRYLEHAYEPSSRSVKHRRLKTVLHDERAHVHCKIQGAGRGAVGCAWSALAQPWRHSSALAVSPTFLATFVVFRTPGMPAYG